jgi:hypothetical protein
LAERSGQRLAICRSRPYGVGLVFLLSVNEKKARAAVADVP